MHRFIDTFISAVYSEVKNVFLGFVLIHMVLFVTLRTSMNSSRHQ
jgi:hypothetical protein